MRIVISGATGSIGSQLMERLSSSHEVVGLGRNESKINNMARRFAMSSCDLESKAFENIVATADCFIHCAAFAAPRGKAARFQKNVDIINAMIPVLEVNDVFTIFVSSASVFDGMSREKALTDPSARPRSLYAKSKYDAEQAVLNSSYNNWTGLRPRAVIGKGDNTVAPRLEALMRGKKVLIPGKGDALLDYTCMENFLDCVEATIATGAQRRFFNVSNGDPRPFKELVSTYAKQIHNITATKHVPLFPLRIMASLFPTDKINHYSLDQISKPMVLDLSATKLALNWQPRQSLEQCLEGM